MSIFDQRRLNQVANNKVAVDQAYHEAWTDARVSTIRLPVDRFWNIVETLRSSILDVDRFDAYKYACNELFRLCVRGDLVVGGTLVTFDELVSFMENWQAVTAALHETLFDIVTDKGDDGYSDLCDALPLIGRQGVAVLLALDSTANDMIVIGVIRGQSPGLSGKSTWLNLIWDTEGYWSMNLENQARDRYPYQAAKHTPKSNTETLV